MEKSVGQPDGYDMMVLKTDQNHIQLKSPGCLISPIHAEVQPAETALRFAEFLVNHYHRIQM
jgi:hypothetical protein